MLTADVYEENSDSRISPAINCNPSTNGKNDYLADEKNDKVDGPQTEDYQKLLNYENVVLHYQQWRRRRHEMIKL